MESTYTARPLVKRATAALAAGLLGAVLAAGALSGALSASGAQDGLSAGESNHVTVVAAPSGGARLGRG